MTIFPLYGSLLKRGALAVALLGCSLGAALAQGLPATAEADRPLPHALSPWGMFQQADVVVQGVMGGLAAAALAAVTILLAKSAEMLLARRSLRRGLGEVSRAVSLAEAARLTAHRSDPAALMVDAAREETLLTGAAVAGTAGEGLKARVSSVLARIEIHAAARLQRGTGLLATIGSVGPFVGLFGTVWGIMNAFIGISEAQTTNLAVVAPGIAEALLATAIGLVAAIPAVVIYNLLQRSNAAYRRLLGDAASAVERLVSRDLDRARADQDGRGLSLLGLAAE